MVEEMKCFYRELDQRKQYLITKLNDEIATLEWQWFQREISDKDYVVALMIYKDVSNCLRCDIILIYNKSKQSYKCN